MLEVITLHLNSLIDFKGEKIAILEMRGFGSDYLGGLPNNSQVRKKLAKANTKEEYLTIIIQYFNELENN
jgi:tRNA-dihydrouridine synthase